MKRFHYHSYPAVAIFIAARGMSNGDHRCVVSDSERSLVMNDEVLNPLLLPVFDIWDCIASWRDKFMWFPS